MIKRPHGINRGLLHFAARLHIDHSNHPSTTAMRTTMAQQIWISNLFSSNDAALDAWDMIPISMLRYSLATSVYSGLPCDTSFARAAYNMAILSDVSHYTQATESDPFITYGVPVETYAWYMNQDMLTRMKICDTPLFQIRINIDPARLVAEATPSAAMCNTQLLLSTEIENLTKNDTETKYYNGYVDDYGTAHHEVIQQVRDMIFADMRPLFISASTGIPLSKVNDIRNSHKLSGAFTSRSTSRGRTPDPVRSYLSNPIGISLFMKLYKITGINTRTTINSRAIIHSHKQLRQMMVFMGFSADSIPGINECYSTAQGMLSGILQWAKCPNTGMHYIQHPEKPINCPCHQHICHERHQKAARIARQRKPQGVKKT